MDKKLLDILVCPLCNSKLTFLQKEKELVCKFDRLSFPFDEDIPVLIPEQGKPLTREQVEKIND